MQYEGKDGPSSNTGGVKAYPIATRFQNQRERLSGDFTDLDRAWRKQYLKDQILRPDEPKIPDWYFKERYNVFRRMYMAPLNTLFKPLKSVIGEDLTVTLRFFTGRGLLAVAGFYIAVYWIKYNGNDWTKQGGWAIASSRDPVHLGSHEPMPKLDLRPGKDYYDQGFKNSPI